MSATNKTTYYELPIFIGTDVPSWLGDWNNAMNTIDSAIQSVDSKANSAQNTATGVQSGLSSTNETVAAQGQELKTIKEAVQNYDSILDFNLVTIVPAVNNFDDGYVYMMAQNTNKTLSTIRIYTKFKSVLSNPTKYTYTNPSGTFDWYDLATVEDNCFKLNQTSLPNAGQTLYLGHCMTWLTPNEPTALHGRQIKAWYDGATTHIGFINSGNLTLENRYVNIITPIFLSGSVYTGGDTPNEA